MSPYKPNRAIPPGYVITSIMLREDVSEEFIASVMDMELATFKKILDSEIAIDDHLAHLLVRAFGGAPEFWTNLQRNYEETLKRLETK